MSSTYPLWQPGQTITAGLLTAGLTVLALKAADQTVASSTTFTDDTDLTLPVEGGGIYRARFVIFALSASTTPDIKTAWSVPSGSTGLKMCQGPTDTAGSFTSRSNTAGRFSGHGFATTVVYQLDNVAVGIEEEGIITIGASDGDITLQWAQNTSNSTATSVLTSSYLTLERLG